jgi:queuine tRNA-ribosyltransferase
MDKSEGLYGYEQTLAPIVQGSVYSDLRKESATFIASRGAEINAIGGLSVGEPSEDMYAMTQVVTDILPADKPRYLMGVGTPANLLESIALGIDMFDCVLPTRNARHGLIYTMEGVMNMKNAKWAKDFSPLDSSIGIETSSRFSKAYLRHLFQVKEYLGAQIASLHNLSFYLKLVREARMRIIDGSFAHWKENLVPRLQTRL